MLIERTPYRFTTDVIRAEVEPGHPGTYVLGDNAGGGIFIPRYVGRSDTDVQGRLLRHNHLYTFEYFIARKAGGPQEAFRQECELWHGHQQQGYDLENKVHPAVPDGVDTCCPYCEFAERIPQMAISQAA